MSTSDPGLRAALKIVRAEQVAARAILLDAQNNQQAKGADEACTRIIDALLDEMAAGR